MNQELRTAKIVVSHLFIYFVQDGAYIVFGGSFSINIHKTHESEIKYDVFSPGFLF